MEGGGGGRERRMMILKTLIDLISRLFFFGYLRHRANRACIAHRYHPLLMYLMTLEDYILAARTKCLEVEGREQGQGCEMAGKKC